MFGKDSQIRWDETIAYLNHHFPCVGLAHRLGEHIETVVIQGLRAEISKELSFGFRGDGKDDAGYDTKTNKRHALRGLLLCQRVYYSDMWAKQSSEGPGIRMEKFDHGLPANWKTTSLTFWSGKTELEIRQGIAMFAPVNGASYGDLQAAAHAGAPNGVALPGNLTLSRNDHDTVGFGVICYVGVQGWLVKSGIISMRWFMKNVSPNKELGCDLIFGQGLTVWNGPFRPELGHTVPPIAPGYIVHIWSRQHDNWNGHWVVTNGNGTICGVNNGEILTAIPPVRKNYTNHSTLLEQFVDYGAQQKVLGGYQTDENRPMVLINKWKDAVMVIIDPLTMPRL
jgi:hypothetical protein